MKKTLEFRARARRGFTLVELLVVIAIIWDFGRAPIAGGASRT